MATPDLSPQATYSKLTRLGFGANFLGGLITFLYLAVINPVPAGEESFRTLETIDVVYFAIAVAIIFPSAFGLGSFLQRPIRAWQNKIVVGTPASDLPVGIARRVLNWPLISSVIIACTWLLSALFFSIFHNSPGNFVGIVIGGVVTTAIIFAGTDLLWRNIIPLFFPHGILSKIPAIRIWVQRRLLLTFILIGAVTPILLVILTLDRARTLIESENPEAILNNLTVVLTFILLVGLATGVVVSIMVSRAIVGPIEHLRGAMLRVENNDLEAHVQVVTNDELGFLGERFNQMTNGLRQGERMRQLFGLYVSPEVARAAVDSGAGLGGELVNCTIMFSDIRDFTTLTEQMPPDKLVDLINQYMTAMVSVIVRNGGMVTRFGGDSILAVYGSPLNPLEDHADRAVAAGVEMRQALIAFNQGESLGDVPTLENGIGIASGSVIAGNVGGKERIEYTVMGDAANLAARLEDLTKETGYPILISSGTYQELPKGSRPEAKMLDDVHIKGMHEKVTVYAIPG